MSRMLFIGLLVTTFSLSACTSHDKQPVVNIPLTATPGNLGQVGMATLAANGDETSISLYISGVPAETTHPVHIYSFIYSGNCIQRESTPTFEMNERVLAYRATGIRGWTISERINTPLDKINTGAYSIVLRTGPADGNREIYCGSNKRSPT